MSDSRFSHLENHAEPGSLPPPVREAIAKLPRFNHLEIGGAALPTSLPSSLPTTAPKIVCGHCGQVNEPEREICWACYETLRRAPDQAAAQNLDIVIDGVHYRSSDANLPADVRWLMDRIRVDGYSAALIEEWRRRRPAPAAPEPSPGDRLPLQIFQGQRVNVLRADGKVYRSDDPNLPEGIRDIFAYVDQAGVTPALLDHLRLYGAQAHFRPITTPQPSEGDVTFWNQVRSSPVAQGTAEAAKFVLNDLYGSDLRGILTLFAVLTAIGVSIYHIWRYVSLIQPLVNQ